MKVRYMPVKGAYLIASGLSRNFVNRKMRDIDILVRKDDFKKVTQYFKSLKEAEFVNSYWEFEQPFIYHLDNQKIYLEIHYLINAPSRFLLSTDDLFDRGIEVNKFCVFPSPADAMLIHICHQLLHIYKSFDKSFFYEIKVLEKQEGYRWEQFWNYAENTGIKPFIWLMIKMYSNITGLKIPAPDWGTFYTSILFHISFERFSRLNPFSRKLLLEIPFVRNPFWLLKHKLSKKILTNKNEAFNI